LAFLFFPDSEVLVVLHRRRNNPKPYSDQFDLKLTSPAVMSSTPWASTHKKTRAQAGSRSHLVWRVPEKVQFTLVVNGRKGYRQPPL
jgi:hypothetical protein